MSAGGGATGLQRQSGGGVVVMPVKGNDPSIEPEVLCITWYLVQIQLVLELPCFLRGCGLSGRGSNAAV